MSQFVSYQIQDGDTIQWIAQKILGDASRSFEIAILNNLDYPFILSLNDSSSSGNVKSPGDSLLIPIYTSDVNLIKISEEPEINVFGSDLLLDSDDGSYGGEFERDIYGDIRTVKGLSCLKQDLFHQLFTPKGSLIYHPEYGSDFTTIIGHKKDDNWKEKATIELIKVFRSDPRVVDVQNVIITDILNGYNIECTVIVPDSSFVIKKYYTP